MNTFVRPETIPLYIETIKERAITEDEVIEKLSAFATEDKIINYQLEALKCNLEWFSNNSVNTLPVNSLVASKEKSSEKPKKTKKGSKWN
jgi:hypothetical protein